MMKRKSLSKQKPKMLQPVVKPDAANSDGMEDDDLDSDGMEDDDLDSDVLEDDAVDSDGVEDDAVESDGVEDDSVESDGVEDDAVESDGVEDEDDDPTEPLSEAPSAKRLKVDVKSKKLSKADLYKAPTNAELSELKETENLFQSSLFRLQVKELLEEVTIKEKKKKLLEDYVKKLSDVLVNIPSKMDKQISDQHWVQEAKLAVPFLQKPYDIQGRFHFIAPESVKTVGSFMLGTAIKPDPHVDLALEIPKACIQQKDYLNQRYLRKRALYLVAIAKHLQKCPLVAELKFAYHHGNHLKPVLVVIPSGNIGKSVTVRLHTCIGEESFKLSRFHINKNNIRPSWFYGENKDQAPCDADNVSTAHYNMSILHDMMMTTCQQALSNSLSRNVCDGLALLKVWLWQRQLNQGYGGFSGFIMSMYVLYLLQQRKLSSLMSSYQIMRNTLRLIAESDWFSQPPSLAPSSNDLPTVAEFQQKFDVLFIDASGYVNYCADMDSSVYKMVRYEARLAVQFLETPGLDSFEMLFMKPVKFYSKYDHVLNITKLSNLTACVEKLNRQNELMDLGGDVIGAIMPSMLRLFEQAAGRRLRAMMVKPRNTAQWSVSEECGDPLVESSLTIGFLVDPDHCNSVVDKGPSADSPQAKQFREVWGDRSELRRFADASICEAVVWQAETAADRRAVLGKVLRYLLHRHLGLPRNSLHSIGGQLDSVLHTLGTSGTGEEQLLSITRCYDDLCKQLRKLQHLPLTIHSIQGVHAAFRFAEVYPAIPVNTPSYIHKNRQNLMPSHTATSPPWQPPHEVLCLLETSGKWPDDVQAVQRIKAAFRVKLAKELHNQYSLITTVFPTHVDVLKDGYVFRVDVGHHKEIVLRKTVTNTDGLVRMVDTESAASLEKQLVVLPKLSSLLHGLHQQHTSYCSAVRLAKRWLSSQLLSAYYLCNEAVELIMATVYIHSAPFATPYTPLTAFVRFLHLLSTHDWKNAPVIINLNSKFQTEDYTSITADFHRDRAALPWMVLITPDDRRSTWTRGQPSAMVLSRIVLLAQQALAQLPPLLEHNHSNREVKQLFRPPLEPFDVILHLNPDHVPRANQAIDVVKDATIPEVCEKPSSKIMPVVGFDPVEQYIAELRAAYGDHALFFHDPYGGTYIAVLWKPTTSTAHDFKTSHMTAAKPEIRNDDVPMLKFNTADALEDFYVLGEGLLTSITEPRN